MTILGSAQGLSDDLDRGRDAFASALQAGDAAAAADAYTDDATLVAPAAEVFHGRSAIERFWQTGIETGIERLELTVLDVRQRGEGAFEVGRYALHLAPESGGVVIDRGRYLVVHRAGPDGRWRRCAEMFSPDRPPSREPSRKESS